MGAAVISLARCERRSSRPRAPVSTWWTTKESCFFSGGTKWADDEELVAALHEGKKAGLIPEHMVCGQ